MVSMASMVTESAQSRVWIWGFGLEHSFLHHAEGDGSLFYCGCACVRAVLLGPVVSCVVRVILRPGWLLQSISARMLL